MSAPRECFRHTPDGVQISTLPLQLLGCCRTGLPLLLCPGRIFLELVERRFVARFKYYCGLLLDIASTRTQKTPLITKTKTNLIIAWQQSSVCCACVLRARVRPCLFIPSRLSPNIVVTQLNLQRRHKNKLLETLVYCHIRMNPDIKVHSVDNLVSIICSQQWARVTGNIFLCPKNICCVHRRRSRCTTLRATCGRRWRPRPASATTPCRCQGPCPSSGRYCRHVDK